MKQLLRSELEKCFGRLLNTIETVPFNSFGTLGTGLDPREGNDLIGRKLLSDNPTCVSRFGRTELQVMAHQESVSLLGGTQTVITSLASGDPWFFYFRSRALMRRAGLDPFDSDTRSKFSTLMRSAMSAVDVLASWVPGERWFANELSAAELIHFHSLEPFRYAQPWTAALEGRRVCVVHPFRETILDQYNNRRGDIFLDKSVLPAFELEVLSPPNAYFGEITSAQSWFDQLDNLKSDSVAVKADTYLIGAGPFGFPLASHLRNCGMSAVVVGGALQLLFGIDGSRWSDDPVIRAMRTSAWRRPRASEVPAVSRRIEKSAYW